MFSVSASGERSSRSVFSSWSVAQAGCERKEAASPSAPRIVAIGGAPTSASADEIADPLEARLWRFSLRRAVLTDADDALGRRNALETSAGIFSASSDLEGVLKRLDLRPNGTKMERIQRLIEKFASVAVDAASSSSEPSEPERPPEVVG